MQRGFSIFEIQMDGQFEPLQGAVAEMKITMNVCSEAEHMGDIERLKRKVKERARGVVMHLPYKKLPGRMVIELVHLYAFWLNVFPPGLKTIHPTMSTRAVLTGLEVDSNNHCKLEFGEYIHTHEEHDNTMASRTCAAIALRPTGNTQVGYYFMSLRTGLRINRNQWTALPLPSTVKLAIEQLAKNNPGGLDIRDRNGRALALDDDEGYISDEDSTYDASDDNNNTDEPLIHDEDVSSNEINKNNIVLDKNADMHHNKNLQHDVIAGVTDDDDPIPDIETVRIPNEDLVGVPIAGVNDEQQQ